MLNLSYRRNVRQSCSNQCKQLVKLAEIYSCGYKGIPSSCFILQYPVSDSAILIFLPQLVVLKPINSTCSANGTSPKHNHISWYSVSWFLEEKSFHSTSTYAWLHSKSRFARKHVCTRTRYASLPVLFSFLKSILVATSLPS